jgi:hypothetical protein
MRRIFWNSNGLKAKKKHKYISDLMKQNGLSFIAILEMGRSELMPLDFSKTFVGEEIFMA